MRDTKIAPPDPVSLVQPEGSLTAAVTGATGGVGQAVATALARGRLHLLWVTGRRRAALESIREDLATTCDARSMVGDLSSEGFRIELVQAIETSCAGLDLLIHCAGVYSGTGITDLTREEYDRVFTLNVFARCDLTRRLLPQLERRQGLVVFVNSSLARQTGRGPGLYAASAHAMRAAADALRQEVGPSRVRVLNVFPGRTATSMQAQIHEFEGKVYEPERLIQPEAVAQAILGVTRLPRDAEVTDIFIRPALPPRT